MTGQLETRGREIRGKSKLLLNLMTRGKRMLLLKFKKAVVSTVL